MRFALWVGFCASLACWPAAGQTSAAASSQLLTRSGIPAAYPPEKDVSPPVEHLLGDLGGIRTNLEGHGVYLLLDATTEFAGNFSGGVKRGSTFANQVGLEADVDWQRLAGLVGLSTHVIVVNRSGSSDSHLFGDDFLPVQEIYGSGGNVAIHLVSAYAEESLFGRRLDVAAGRMNVENDFGSSPLYCQFMNNALCGDPKALPGGDIGHSAFPDAVWAGRVHVRPTPVTSFKAGVYEVNQGLYSDANFRSGFKFDTSQDSGVYLPIEAAYEPLVGLSRMPGHYKIGFGYDTSPFYGGFAVKPSAAASNVSGVKPSRRNGNTQAWFLLDQMVLRQGPSDIDGIIILAGFVHNDPNNSAYAEQYFAGVLDRGFWPARPHDAIGLLVTHNTASRVLGRVQSREAALGLPISNGASGPQTHETVVELNYDVHLAQGLTFQPELQYVRHPNAQASIPSAVVFGFKAHVEF
jgi:porin